MAANLEEDEDAGGRGSIAASSVGGDILRLGTPPSTGGGRYWDDDVQVMILEHMPQYTP